MSRIRAAIAEMEQQRIGAVANLALGNPDVIPLWFGESDLVTPDFIRQAAKDALDAGHTFYVNKRGIPPLRQSIIGYLRRVHDVELAPERLTVTGSGMTAIMIAVESLIGQGDNAVLISPIWPNIFYAVRTMGGESRYVRLRQTAMGWKLDLDRLFAACDERTRAIFIASPSNPTGWLMREDEQQAVLDFARRRGIWIIADEVYHRLVYDRPVAPSFLSIAQPDDPVFVVNSFSKSWAMTGWRLGWLVHPPALGDRMGDLSGINNTGATTFVQHAGVAAIEQGEAFIAQMVERCRRGRDLVHQRLAGMSRVTMNRPEAAFYAFFKVDGVTDDLTFAQNLVRTARVGLAPGSAFGPDNAGYFRLCFASAEARLSEALDRLAPALS